MVSMSWFQYLLENTSSYVHQNNHLAVIGENTQHIVQEYKCLREPAWNYVNESDEKYKKSKKTVIIMMM